MAKKAHVKGGFHNDQPRCVYCDVERIRKQPVSSILPEGADNGYWRSIRFLNVNGIWVLNIKWRQYKREPYMRLFYEAIFYELDSIHVHQLTNLITQ